MKSNLPEKQSLEFSLFDYLIATAIGMSTIGIYFLFTEVIADLI